MIDWKFDNRNSLVTADGTKLEYEFHKHDGWTRCITRRDDEPIKFSIRCDDGLNCCGEGKTEIEALNDLLFQYTLKGKDYKIGELKTQILLALHFGEDGSVEGPSLELHKIMEECDKLVYEYRKLSAQISEILKQGNKKVE